MNTHSKLRVFVLDSDSDRRAQATNNLSGFSVDSFEQPAEMFMKMIRISPDACVIDSRFVFGELLNISTWLHRTAEHGIAVIILGNRYDHKSAKLLSTSTNYDYLDDSKIDQLSFLVQRAIRRNILLNLTSIGHTRTGEG